MFIIFTETRFRFFGRKNPLIKPLFTYWYHAAIITLLVVFIKLTFERDLGDYIIGTYMSIILYVSGFIFVARKLEIHGKGSNEPIGRPKYEKSPLSELEQENKDWKPVFNPGYGVKYISIQINTQVKCSTNQ
jgi:hypothetical protein